MTVLYEEGESYASTKVFMARVKALSDGYYSLVVYGKVQSQAAK